MKCNTGRGKNFQWGSPAEAISGASVDLADNGIEFILCNVLEITAFRKIEAKNTVRILICAALPGLMRFGKVYRCIQFLLHGMKLGEL